MRGVPRHWSLETRLAPPWFHARVQRSYTDGTPKWGRPDCDLLPFGGGLQQPPDTASNSMGGHAPLLAPCTHTPPTPPCKLRDAHTTHAALHATAHSLTPISPPGILPDPMHMPAVSWSDCDVRAPSCRLLSVSPALRVGTPVRLKARSAATCAWIGAHRDGQQVHPAQGGVS